MRAFERSVLDALAGIALVSTVSVLHGQAPPRKRLLFLSHAARYTHSSLAPAEAADHQFGKTGDARHREDSWSTDDTFRAHLTGGIRWALGIEN